MESSNTQLVQHLLDTGVLRTPHITVAFEAIDRTDFVLKEQKEVAYADYPLSIGYGATISQPTTVAFMLELLQPEEGDRVLDIGAGSGWTTALLSYIAGQGGNVIGLEIVPELVKLGTRNVHKYFPFQSIILAEDVLGLPERAPFDRILVSAASEEVPQELLQQLAVGGRMVLPVKDAVVRIERLSDEQFRQEEYPGFAFVPLR
jgi:protein-L-isoaspartate(D-aspartate) O-methyltransferase